MSGTPRCCNTLRSTPLGNLDPVIRLFEGIFLTASANLIRNREFHVDYLGHAHCNRGHAGIRDPHFLFPKYRKLSRLWHACIVRLSSPMLKGLVQHALPGRGSTCYDMLRFPVSPEVWRAMCSSQVNIKSRLTSIPPLTLVGSNCSLNCML